MIPFNEALALILDQVAPFNKISVGLEGLSGYVLAESVTATMMTPRFDNAALDGFGLRAAEVAEAAREAPVRLRLCGTLRAGKDGGQTQLPTGCAVKIFTGAPIPDGVDAVVMKEDCQERDGDVLVAKAVRPNENIRRAGEEFQPGQVVLPAGVRVTPPVIGLLATFGYTAIPVYRKPEVALVVTGDELVPPGQPLHPGQIYDANSYAVAAALEGLHIPVRGVYHAEDEREILTGRLREALESADVVITVGGVSVGEFDFVRVACADLGFTTHIWKVAMKPGKPSYFATRGTGVERKYVFGLPGNPVSALLTFRLIVRPALAKMLGAPAANDLQLPAMLTTVLKKKAGRKEFIRGVACSNDGRLEVTPTVGQESHMLGGLALANCLIHFPADESSLAPGTTVTIELLDWTD